MHPCRLEVARQALQNGSNLPILRQSYLDGRQLRLPVAGDQSRARVTVASVSLIRLPFGGNNALIFLVSAVRKVPDCHSDRRPARRQKPVLMVPDTLLALPMSGREATWRGPATPS